MAYRQALFERAGGTLSAEATAEMLGVSAEAVRRRIRRGRLIAMRASKGYSVPTIQFENGEQIAGLSQALATLTIDSPWMRLDWLLNPEPRPDDMTPFEALQSGLDLARISGAAA